jgi:hypothetical protein
MRKGGVSRTRPVSAVSAVLAVSFPVFLFFCGCDLLLNKPEIDLENTMDAKIALANAPYVPVRIEEGGLGTASPRGALDTAVKLGYSFLLNYVPKSEYPFRGWQAKLEGGAGFLAARTVAGEESGADAVRFVPLNEAGTEAEVFVYVKPDARIVIGPLGADNPELSVRVDEGGTGTASPRGLVSGIRVDFPFRVSFLPNANYDFKGWQLRREGSGDLLGSWTAGAEAQAGELISFVPQNLAGTEIEITIHQDPMGGIIVEPLNGDNPFLAVELSGGGLGTISPTGILTGVIKQGFAFSVSYLAGSAYSFTGWQARLAGEAGLLASWTVEGSSGADKVVFAPQNITGTEVKITALINPLTAEGEPGKIIIGPLGADSAALDVEVATGGLGTASPQGPVSGVRVGFPFLISYQPNSAYPFTGWQAKVAGSAAPLATWTSAGATGADKVSFARQNVTGTEVRVTALKDPGGKLTIGPLGADYPEVEVRVAYPEAWGRSPQFGEIQPRPRRSLPFTVNFTPAAEYGFEKWIAVRNGDYDADNPGATDLSKDLNGKGASIVESLSDSGACVASVTINIAEGITLMPWCEERPRIIQATPPLTASPNPFPYDQRISLWFNRAIGEIRLGEALSAYTPSEPAG